MLKPLLTSSADRVKSTTRLERASVFEKLWKVADLAEHLAVSPKTVYDWVHRRQITYHKVGRLLRFRPSEIEKWLISKGESHNGNR